MDERYVGGISRTENYMGYLFDIGGHRFFSKSKEVVDLWNEILPDDFIERPRLSRIYYNGRFFSYPLKAFEALNNLGYLESALCCRNILAGRNLYDVWNVNEDAEYHEAGGSGKVEALGSVRQVPQRVGRVA